MIVPLCAVQLGSIGASGTLFSAVTKLDTSLNDDPVVRLPSLK